jgi:transcriptional regulator of acetoin/glycerol metabolism
VHESRQKFLTSGQVPAGLVREDIATSWRRSRLCGVDPQRLRVPYEPDEVNPTSRLHRAATPVLERFAARLTDTPTGLFLADRQARGVQRWVGQPSLAKRFDAVGAADGFRFDEELAGTNALGTTIELGRPVTITASEHWVEQLSALTCAGAPIRNPITRQIEGVVDLSCVNEHNADLLLALVLEIAFQVEERFYLEASVDERLMLQHFTSAARNSSRPVMAVNKDMILTNPAAARLVRNVEQELLWDLAARVTHANTAVSETLIAAEQSTVAHCRPVRDGGEVIGVVIELKLEGPPVRRSARSTRVTRKAELPGLVGHSPAWRGVCQQVLSIDCATACLVVTGETGTGKMAVARAWYALRGVEDPLVLDAAAEPGQGADRLLPDIDRALQADDGRPGALLLAHVEHLSPAAAAALSAHLERAPASRMLAVTVTTGPGALATHTESLLDRLRTVRVELPPLRHRREDISDLVAAFDGDGGTCTSETMQALVRSSWPRNVRELRHVIEAARSLSPQGPLQLDHLPKSVQRGSRRGMLSVIEQAELDAIVAALHDAGGNKVDAALALGISRSTLYRKMHTYGLDLDRAAF